MTALRPRPDGRLARRLPDLALALLAYVPLLLTRPGQVGADTKTYLYLDPGRLLRDAVNMWDTGVGLGTVTHQNIGYLWPMGPWYWTLERLGLPDWVAQRLWLGTVILAAGFGIRWMLRELRWNAAGATVAAFAYAFSPYLLHYGARISVILLPWAGLPWLIGLSARALRRGGWRDPAIFALVVMTVGGINFTSLALVMIGPLLWFVHAVWVEREVRLRQAIGTGLRISVLTVATSLWWAVGLTLQGRYGIPILRYTETYEVVAKASNSVEVLRGLGYWFFYGRDGLGPWIQPAITMVQFVPVLFVSLLLPILSFTAGFLVRFRHRVFFVGCIAAGVLVSVGANPWDSPSPAGSLLKAWTRTDLGLAFRSTPRAIPLVSLGGAVLLAAGVAALGQRLATRLPQGLGRRVPARLLVSLGALTLIVFNQPGLFMGRMVDRYLQRAEDVPAYWHEVASELDRGDHDTRAYEFPGADFASYRWGNTVDPITPGLMDRDYAARELIPYGSAASADLLNAFDAPLQEGRLEPATVAPLLRLFGVGQAVFRADLQFERFRTPRPRNTFWALQRLVDAGQLGAPTGYGPTTRNEPVRRLPLDDEIAYGTPEEWPDPHQVEVFPVTDPRPMIRTVADSPVVLAGSGDGLVSYAATGALDVDRPVLYAAAIDEVPAGAELVVTDSNRRRARRWGSVRENDGYTEVAGEQALVEDRADNRLDLFPDSTDDDRTVAEQVPVPLADGRTSIGARVVATGYGNPVTYTAGDRAAFALDGDVNTAWKVGAFDDVIGEYLEVRLDEPVSTDHLRLLQRFPVGNRWMTAIDVSFDGGPARRLSLGEPSREDPAGERLELGGEQRFSTVRITVADTNLGAERLARYRGVSEVGIAELGFGTERPVRIREVLRPPVALLQRLGDRAADHPLSYVFARRHAGPGEVTVADEEPTMLRRIDTPTARGFTATGVLRLSDTARPEQIDRLLGWGGLPAGQPEARNSRRLPGAPTHRAAAAFDGSPDTFWQSPVNFADNQWIGVTTPAPHTTDTLTVTAVADGRHSLPTRLRLEADGRIVAAWDTPFADNTGRPSVQLTFPQTTASEWRVVIETVDAKRSIDWFGGNPTTLPSAIAEADLGVQVAPPGPEQPWNSGCRDDLLTIGGQRIPIEATGTVGDLLRFQPMSWRQCGTAAPVEVPAGSSLLQTGDGPGTGLTVDLVSLRSPALGTGTGPGASVGAPPPGAVFDAPAAAPVDAPVAAPADAPAAAPAPTMRLQRTGRVTYRATVTEARAPYWLVLGQSHNLGWRARTSDGVDLGEPVIVNGYANGWRVDPNQVGPDTTIELEWTPQRRVWIGIGLSVIGILVCLWLAVRPPRRLRGRTGAEAAADAGPMDITTLSPFDRFGRVDTLAASAALTLCTGLIGWLTCGPVVGGALAAACLLGLRVRWGWVLVRFAAVGSLSLAGAYVVAKQSLNNYPVDFDWPQKFGIVHPLGLLTVGLLVVDVIIEHRRGGWRRRAGVDL